MAAPLTDDRRRGLLEVGTAIMLGLVAVATSAGAYQASEWSRQAGAYESAAGQLRDVSLASSIASQLASFDDNERVTEAIALDLKIDAGAVNADELRTRQAVLIESGSPELAAAWAIWIENGRSDETFPLLADEVVVPQLAPTYGANRASSVAYGLADDIGDRGFMLTIASAVFALALLLLGVSGAIRSLGAAFALAVGGAGTFVVGLAISALTLVG